MTFIVESGDIRAVVSGDDHLQAAIKALEKSDVEWLGVLTRVKACHSRAAWRFIETRVLLESPSIAAALAGEKL